MTEKEARRARKFILAFLPAHIPEHEKDDATQEVLIDMIKHNKTLVSKQYVLYRWYDYVRRALGRTRSLKWSRPEFTSLNVLDSRFDDGTRGTTRDISVEHKDFAQVDSRDEIDLIMSKLSPRERVLAMLRFGQGYTLKTIGRMLGKSEAWVSWSSSELERKLRRLGEQRSEALEEKLYE